MRLEDGEEVRAKRAVPRCPKYPECKTTMPLEDEVPVEAPNVPCPTCGGVMRVRTAGSGSFWPAPAIQTARDAPFTLQILSRMREGSWWASHEAGKNFGCSAYPACTFGLWDRPLKQPCPACVIPSWFRSTKTKGDYQQCPVQGEVRRGRRGGAEELSGTVDR